MVWAYSMYCKYRKNVSYLHGEREEQLGEVLTHPWHDERIDTLRSLLGLSPLLTVKLTVEEIFYKGQGDYHQSLLLIYS